MCGCGRKVVRGRFIAFAEVFVYIFVVSRQFVPLFVMSWAMWSCTAVFVKVDVESCQNRTSDVGLESVPPCTCTIFLCAILMTENR